MQVFHQLEDLGAHAKPAAVAIGNFDGCHLGHRALIKTMVKYAHQHQLAPTVLTFYPHPVEVLNPKKLLERLTTTSEKLSLLESLGVASILVERFDVELAGLSAETFYQKYLVEGLMAKSVHVGFNFRFGKGRQGDTKLLEQLGAQGGVHVEILDPFQAGEERVSSSAIRALIREGNVSRAAEFLGRPYSLSGQVYHGDGRGKTIGVPTANLRYPLEKVVPKDGVYVTRALWQRQSFRSVANIGVRPTFHPDAVGVAKPTLEVHLLDFTSPLYDEFLQLEFLERIRDEKKFDSVDSLKTQIAKDIQYTRSVKLMP